MDYRPGQIVSYRSNGVFRIDAIGKPDFLQGNGKDYYTLLPVFSKSQGTYYIPVDVNGLVRPVISSEEAQQYLNQLAEMVINPFPSIKQQELTSHYRQLLSSCDLEKHLYLMKEICLKNRGKQETGKLFSATDEQYLKKVEQLLSEEFAIALQETPEVSKARLYAAIQHNL